MLKLWRYTERRHGFLTVTVVTFAETEQEAFEKFREFHTRRVNLPKMPMIQQNWGGTSQLVGSKFDEEAARSLDYLQAHAKIEEVYELALECFAHDTEADKLIRAVEEQRAGANDSKLDAIE